MLAVDLDKGILELDHDLMRGPGFLMLPMQMSFTIEDRALLTGVSPGDRVRFRVSEEHTSQISELKKLPQ